MSSTPARISDEVSAGVRERLLREPETRDTPPESSRLQQPHADNHDDKHVQYRLDTGGHGDEAIDQVQPHSNYDQHDDNIQQRHIVAPSVFLKSNPAPVAYRRGMQAQTGVRRHGSRPALVI